MVVFFWSHILIDRVAIATPVQLLDDSTSLLRKTRTI